MTISPDNKKHARPRLCEFVMHWAAAGNQPLYEGLVTMHITKKMMAEEKKVRDRSTKALIGASRERLEEADMGREKFIYTRRHSLEVAYFSYIIASVAKSLGVPGSERMTPELSFAGGFVHDIGKTFLPPSLLFKELGVMVAGLCIWEGRPLNSIEKRVLRDRHISAGTTFVRLFNGDDNPVMQDMVGLHHVMYSGKGSMYPSYPANKSGKSLGLAARIAKTADFLSAVLPRHYRTDEWVLSMTDSIGYAIAVSGVELDPLTVKCFILGTHDLDDEEAGRLVGRLAYKGSVQDIADFHLMRRYVKESVEMDPEFMDMVARRSMSRIDAYRGLIGRCASDLGAPSLDELSIQ